MCHYSSRNSGTLTQEINMHDVFVVGIPLIVIVAGILLNRSDVRELRQEGTAQHSEIMARLASINSGIREFYHLTLNGENNGTI